MKRSQSKLIIITGLSGSGKTIALHSLEDQGYFCIDNLSPKMIIAILEKINDPKEKGDLRNLSLTLFVSKLVENIVYDLLLKKWGDKIDPGQFGGRKGYSVLLYLIKLTDFILSNLDQSKAVLLALVDFAKAYNRQSHNRLLT